MPSACGWGLPSPVATGTCKRCKIVGLGLDPVRVSKVAGHSNVSVTLNIYAEEFDEAMHRDDLLARIEKAGFRAI